MSSSEIFNKVPALTWLTNLRSNATQVQGFFFHNAYVIANLNPDNNAYVIANLNPDKSNNAYVIANLNPDKSPEP